MKNMFKFSFVLASYTVVTCVGLAFVYNVTSPVITARAAAELKAALTEVFPEAGDFDDVTDKMTATGSSIIFENAFVVKKDGEAIGMIIKATGPTYASATILVGVDTSGSLRPVRFMSLSDTPGLGMKAKDEPFKRQFTRKSVRDPFKAGNIKTGADIEAISGSTITSKGVSNIVKAAGLAAADYLARK